MRSREEAKNLGLHFFHASAWKSTCMEKRAAQVLEAIYKTGEAHSMQTTHSASSSKT